jgi:hypothetical protein
MSNLLDNWRSKLTETDEGRFDEKLKLKVRYDITANIIYDIEPSLRAILKITDIDIIHTLVKGILDDTDDKPWGIRCIKDCYLGHGEEAVVGEWRGMFYRTKEEAKQWHETYLTKGWNEGCWEVALKGDKNGN